MSLVHASCVAVQGRGVLLTGASGSGKSDLALRLLARGGQLVSDDQVEVEVRGGALIATAPAAIRGLMEVRGVGLVRQPAVSESVLHLVLAMVPRDQVPRLPEAEQWRHGGLTLPLYKLYPFADSAADKALLLVRALGEDILVDR